MDALSFPMKKGTGGVAYVTVAGVKNEAMGFLVGPVNVSAMPYRVFVSCAQPRGMKPVNIERREAQPMTMLQSLGRWFDGVVAWQGPKPTNSRLRKEQAISITKAETERQGWPWNEPVHIGHVDARPFTQK